MPAMWISHVVSVLPYQLSSVSHRIHRGIEIASLGGKSEFRAMKAEGKEGGTYSSDSGLAWVESFCKSSSISTFIGLSV
jgi:hypothetical protein